MSKLTFYNLDKSKGVCEWGNAAFTELLHQMNKGGIDPNKLPDVRDIGIYTFRKKELYMPTGGSISSLSTSSDGREYFFVPTTDESNIGLNIYRYCDNHKASLRFSLRQQEIQLKTKEGDISKELIAFLRKRPPNAVHLVRDDSADDYPLRSYELDLNPEGGKIHLTKNPVIVEKLYDVKGRHLETKVYNTTEGKLIIG